MCDDKLENGGCSRRDGHEGEKREQRLQWSVSKPKRSGSTAKLTQNPTAMMGNPFFVHLAKIRGAWPRRASPYKIRDEVNKKLLPAENALVKTPALMMWGKTLIPALLMAIT